MAITLADAEAKVAFYMAAEDAIVTGGQKMTWNGRTVELPSLSEVRKSLSYWNQVAERLGSSSLRKPAQARFYP